MKPSTNQLILENLQRELRDDRIFNYILKDFTTTFMSLGCGNNDVSWGMALYLIAEILRAKKLEDAERSVKNFFDRIKFKGNKTIFGLISEGLEERIEIIFNQIKPHIRSTEGNVIDFGCGDGRVAQLLHDRLGLNIEGVDVRSFRAKGVTISVKKFDGGKVPVRDKYYECALLTNVIHHEESNEKILKELSRIVRNKLVIIETVPEASTRIQAKKDWGRMFLNDTLWNRFFNYADIPVPGKYETPSDWIRRFKKYGWKVVVSEDLGMDQPTIQDRHHLLVFERR
jgi:ubiquinone/menaquinone biosynthesis C-methylase UbiE